MTVQDTIAALATPPGLGSIAVIRISGEGALSVAEKVFCPRRNRRLRERPGYSALFGDFVFRARQIDEGVALLFRGPNSYTGEDVVELSCHGGAKVSQDVLLACFEAGARPANAGEFTRRAVLNGKMTLTQAEAVMDVIAADSQAALSLAGNALRGKTFQKLQRMKMRLLALASHLAAYVDFPEEEVEELTLQSFIDTLRQVGQELDELTGNYQTGEIIRRGVQTAIVGSPNVGKSTLFNLLSGFERAIVTDIAGTTRDVLREQIQIAGIGLHLADTAGIHQSACEIEAEGIRRSFTELDSAALVIAVFDGSMPLTVQDRQLAERCKEKRALGLVNKSDLGKAWNKEEIEHCFTVCLEVSAQEEQTKTSIENAIKRIVQVKNISPDTVMLANGRQLFAATQARQALRQAEEAIINGMTYDIAGVCLQEALQSMAELTGEDVQQTVIDDVFSRFCVGK